MVWISRSHMPPILEADGTFILNSIKLQSWDRRNFLTGPVFTSFKAALSSFFPPTKFVPWSHFSWCTLRLWLMNGWRALINASVSMVFKVSKWMEESEQTKWIEQRQVKTKTQRFNSWQPSLIYQGPKTSMPTYGKGGAGVTRSSGRLAIFCVWAGRHNLRQVVHFRRLASLRM